MSRRASWMPRIAPPPIDQARTDAFANEAEVESDLILLEHLKSGRKAFVDELCSASRQQSEEVLSVLRQGLLLAAVGVALGLLGSWVLTRAITSQLFGVSTTDPFIFTATPAALVLVAILACYLPARRAARTDTASVLRTQ